MVVTDSDKYTILPQYIINQGRKNFFKKDHRLITAFFTHLQGLHHLHRGQLHHHHCHLPGLLRSLEGTRVIKQWLRVFGSNTIRPTGIWSTQFKRRIVIQMNFLSIMAMVIGMTILILNCVNQVPVSRMIFDQKTRS
jgi:hypothetical protein